MTSHEWICSLPASRTFTGACANAWSDSSCWAGVVPVDGDDVRVTGSAVVTFDFIDRLKLNSLYIGPGIHLRKLGGAAGELSG